VATIAVIVLAILTWVLMGILLALVVARVTRLNRSWDSAVEPSPPAPLEKPVPGPIREAMAGFPVEPRRFVGRGEVMVAAGVVLTSSSGCRAVVFHGVAGVGKTTCAVQLAYRHQRDFVALVFWSAPTDPDQCGDALGLFAVELDAQLGDHGFVMVEEIASLERVENVIPTLAGVFADAGLLLVLDNLEVLLTPDGQWRDRRWVPLIGALTGHRGSSRVLLTSRIVPVGLNCETVLVRRVHALSREESLLLIGELPHLCALFARVALARCVLTLAQGHPALLELADAAAAEPSRLVYQLAEIEAAVDGAPLAAFLTQGHTRLGAEQLLATFTAWTLTVAATLPAPARLLLQVLCRIEQADRRAAVVGANWAAVWRRLDQPGAPPPLGSGVAALVSAALIVTDPIDAPADSSEPVCYRIHSGVAEAIHAATPEPVTAAVDAQLAAWWSAVVGGWAGIEPQQAGTDPSQGVVGASLAAARYLLRQRDCNAASCLLERTLIREGYSPVSSLAVLPLLRRIAEATGALKDLVVLAAAARKVDPGEAETLLRRAGNQARAQGNYQLASTTAGELVTVLRDQGRLPEALTLAAQKIEYSRQAGFGCWTQLSDQGRRLQILSLLGHHEQVLTDVPALRARMADLPDQRADNDRVNPWNVREGVLELGRSSAVALQRWEDALDLNDEITSTKRRSGAAPHEIARSRFHDHLPLLHLGRLTELDHLLRDCHDIFDTAGDITGLAAVASARADLADTRAHPVEALSLQRTSLRLCYVHPDPHEIATAHHHLANYLAHAAGNPAEQRAHRLTAALLNHLTGNTRELTTTLGALASELRSDPHGPNAPTLPTTLPEITRLIDTADGVRFGTLLLTLCPDPPTAEHALADLLTTAAISAHRAR
jgi:hypothetical protein